MAGGSAGLEGQLGFKSESAWGTAVTPDKFHPGWLSGMPTLDQSPIKSNGIRAGRRYATCLSPGGKILGGTISTELHPQPMSTLLRHMTGSVVDTGSGPYDHTATMGSLKGQSMTVQFGVSDDGGTVRSFTFFGCKMPKWSLSGKAGEVAMLSFDISAKDYTTATGLASASYPAVCPFVFTQGSVLVNGVQQGLVKGFTLDNTRPMRTGNDGLYMGSPLIKEQKETGRIDTQISVDAEFEDLTIHDLANTDVATVLEFDNGTASMTFTTNTWVEGSLPGVNGVDALNSFAYKLDVHGTSDAAAITAVLHNAEATAT